MMVDMAGTQNHRWTQVLDSLIELVSGGPAYVVVDGYDGQAGTLADRLAESVRLVGHRCYRLSSGWPAADEDAWRSDTTGRPVVIADGPRWRAHPPVGAWDMVIWVRTPEAAGHSSARPCGGGPERGGPERGGPERGGPERGGRERGGPGSGEHGADVVIDLHDPAWPVIRHVAKRLSVDGRWYLTETQAFFTPRAATWDTRFGDDLPAYAAAVADAGVPVGGTAIDVGCGTGRALLALREAVGNTGVVLGIDLTPQMLATARAQGRHAHGGLVLADARRLPLPAGRVDVVFAAGLVAHLPDVTAGLAELARVTRSGGRLVLFHPSGRAALAARHGRTLRPDEPLAEGPLGRAMSESGWVLDRYDDARHRFFARGIRS